MYFGALSIGADLAVGLIAANLIWKRKARMQLVFRSFRADFLKRPESDVYFICEEGAKVRAQFERALKTGERQNEDLRIHGRVKKKNGGYDTVADFTVALSLKRE
ncbi:MAG: hypothetical protein HYW49_06690 [Deltaproteobacteria bacterium]|nr:hypothetical protein [Deltaproteobacteria bacterium]